MEVNDRKQELGETYNLLGWSGLADGQLELVREERPIVLYFSIFELIQSNICVD